MLKVWCNVFIVANALGSGRRLNTLRGGGFSPDFCKNTILRYELAMMARTCTNNLRVVLSPYVQHCPCEASEQKMGPKNQYIKQGDRA